MGVKTVERFADAPATETKPAQMVSPTMKNLLSTPDVSVQSGPYNPLQRELDIVEVKAVPVTLIETADDNNDDEDTDGAATSACPKCPDMSQYIRMDEIPCWNCTLP